jgi:hypothetical protein
VDRVQTWAVCQTPDLGIFLSIRRAGGSAHGKHRDFPEGSGAALNQGVFQEVTIRNQDGYLAVYAVGELALLAVIGTNGLNIARLHIEARTVTARLATMLTRDPEPFDWQTP